jgi:hypothetical protein
LHIPLIQKRLGGFPDHLDLRPLQVRTAHPQPSEGFSLVRDCDHKILLSWWAATKPIYQSYKLPSFCHLSNTRPESPVFQPGRPATIKLTTIQEAENRPIGQRANVN